MTLGNDNGTDGQTDRQTDRRTDRVRRNMRPPPREEGRIIIIMPYNSWASSISDDTRETSHYFVSASFGAGAAFQCCSATRQPAGP